MSAVKILVQIVISTLLILILVHGTVAAPSGVSIASTGGSNGAIAGFDNDGGAIAMSGVPVVAPQYGDSTIGGGSSGGGVLSMRTGGSSPPKSQSVLVGSNGDTTILQQSGDQPVKVYKISG